MCIVRYLIKLQRGPERLLHPLVNDWDKVAHFASARHVDLTNSKEGLRCRIEMLEEENERSTATQRNPLCARA